MTNPDLPRRERLVAIDVFRGLTVAGMLLVNDPGTWERPWTISFPWRRDPNYGFFEYACHEGNYAMPNILSGGRADDRAAEQR